jgi:multicomponent Na+:H+ antiporter subunit E
LKQLLSLTVILAVFWLVNSGHYTPMLLGLGAFSIGLILFISKRMEHVDGKFEPSIVMSIHLPFYLFWLLVEIIKSNLDVVARVWKGEAAISPTVFKVKASQKSDVCRVLYANSITMTPGTITLDIDGDTFEVHALSEEGKEGVLTGEMDKRVSKLER